MTITAEAVKQLRERTGAGMMECKKALVATNCDLDAWVRAGRFRRDLLYRLNAATVVLPPLRERPRELVLLSRAFLDDACRRREAAQQPDWSLHPGRLAHHQAVGTQSRRALGLRDQYAEQRLRHAG